MKIILTIISTLTLLLSNTTPQESRWSPITGLKIEKYYKTSLEAKLSSNNASREYASMFGLALDMREYGISKTSIQATDYLSQKRFLASKAIFLVGSKIPSPNSKISKIAFIDKQQAQKHQKEYGGEITSFANALEIAKKSLDQDIHSKDTIHKKRYHKIGEKIFKKRCKKDIDPQDFLEINELKNAIIKEKLCLVQKEKHLHPLSLYIWEVKRANELEEIVGKVEVKQNEKCPVCGMFVYKYPKWAAQIVYSDKKTTHIYSFDGVKDLIKFYFSSNDYLKIPFEKSNIEKLLVTDYYTQKAIDGTKAFYVIRSNVYGPMGHEFIPFKTVEDARNFRKDHGGTEILLFSDITEKLAFKLDSNE